MFGARSFATPAVDPASIDTFADINLVVADPKVLFNHVAPDAGSPLSINWKNTGANSIDSRVLGSNDLTAADADWEIVVVAAAIAAGAMRQIHIATADYMFYKLQHKATVGAAQGASKVRGAIKSIG